MAFSIDENSLKHYWNIGLKCASPMGEFQIRQGKWTDRISIILTNNIHTMDFLIIFYGCKLHSMSKSGKQLAFIAQRPASEIESNQMTIWNWINYYSAFSHHSLMKVFYFISFRRRNEGNDFTSVSNSHYCILLWGMASATPLLLYSISSIFFLYLLYVLYGNY